MLLRIAPLLRAGAVVALWIDPQRWGTDLSAGLLITLNAILAADYVCFGDWLSAGGDEMTLIL